MPPVLDIADFVPRAPSHITTDLKVKEKDMNADMTNYLSNSIYETLSGKLQKNLK